MLVLLKYHIVKAELQQGYNLETQLIEHFNSCLGRVKERASLEDEDGVHHAQPKAKGNLMP